MSTSTLARIRPATRVLIAMVATGGLLEALALTGRVESPFVSLLHALTFGNYAVSSALAGAFAIEWFERPSRRYQLLAFAAGLAVIQGVAWRLTGSSLGFLVFNLSTPFGVVAIGARIRDLITAPRTQRYVSLDALAVTLLLPVFCVVGEKLLSTLSLAYPATLDGGLLLADRALGGAPSFTIGQIVQGNGIARRLVDIIYVELPLAFVIVSLATQRVGARGHMLLREFALYGGASFILLPLVPAAGPVYAFAGYPDVLPTNLTHWLAVAPDAFRNCVPSMHTTWALLLFFRARHGTIWLRAFALFWLAVTLLATLGKGEHYVLDLVVACPFLLVLESVPQVNASLAVGCALLFGWLATLRFGLPLLIENPRATLVAAVGTVVVSVALAWQTKRVRREVDLAQPFAAIEADPQARRDAA